MLIYCTQTAGDQVLFSMQKDFFLLVWNTQVLLSSSKWSSLLCMLCVAAEEPGQMKSSLRSCWDDSAVLKNVFLTTHRPGDVWLKRHVGN